MKLKYSLALLAVLSSGLIYAEAPVVDDSANYAENYAQDEPFIAGKPVKQVEQDSQEWQQPISQGNQDNEVSDDAGLLAKFNAMQQEIQQLRGQLEVQAHDLKLLQQQQLAFYKDLDSRLSSKSAEIGSSNRQAALSLDDNDKNTEEKPANNESSQVNSVGAGAKQEVSTKKLRGNPADEQLSYVAAFQLIKKKEFDQALEAMQAFVENYPQSQYAPNAHYWSGELYLLKHQFLFASREFTTVLKQFPRSTKVAASTLKLGYAYADMGNLAAAKRELNQVIQHYPDTSTAQLAKQKLIQLSGGD